MYYLIYQITNINTGKIYVGAHKTSNINDGYMGSGKYLKRAIEKYGVESFRKEILFSLEDESSMWKKEAEIVNEEFLITANTYNIKLGGNGGFSSDEAKKGRAKTDEILRERYGEDFRKVISELGREKSLSSRRRMKEENPDFWKPTAEMAKKGHLASLTEESRQKRKETMKQNGHSQGEKNSQFGSMWIHNPETLENKKISKECTLPNGWIKGRKLT